MKSAVEDDGTLAVHSSLVEGTRKSGFDVIVSVGKPEENKIGSNCGLFIRRHLHGSKGKPEIYSSVKSNTNSQKS
jgi:23S rRNA (adenine2503-C2)-methyltransferase